jgi:hypothetical protein
MIHNGLDPAAPNGVAKDMGELTHDVVSLVELQFELFRSDCRDGLKGLLLPIGLLLFAGLVTLGTVPLGLLLLAEILVQVAGLSRASALSIATFSGILTAAVLVIVGWFYLHRAERLFEHSREELTRNMTWIKRALKRPVPIDSEHA